MRSWNISETGNRQCKDAGGPRSHIDILTVVPAQQGDHLSLETPATSLRIRGDSLAERNGNANGARNRRFLRMDSGSFAHNRNRTKLVLNVPATVSGAGLQARLAEMEIRAIPYSVRRVAGAVFAVHATDRS